MIKMKKVLFFILVFFVIGNGIAFYINFSDYLQSKTSYQGGYTLKRNIDVFLVNGCGNETILDTQTGLCWDSNFNRGGSRTWDDAVLYCNNLNSTHPSGLQNWRLPTGSEFFSILDETRISKPGIVDVGFTNVQSNYYWTSSSKGSKGYKFNIFQGGYGPFPEDKTNLNYVTCLSERRS
jgi:hypothetical protein